ncbi:uncharacterized protein LOC128987055 isoform X2 [Macrosteles quadrilineatus]|uniref:uncharacterized protein LOC128987055 isoform X2 n=1 Tax=Macrosteles quadrilineatus TaxID=74068 RepID=UPI0023E19F6A|nr:uncharacterized protein LOC128987055 isoform X2 [Macrosteles quadrilineatus]
MAAVVVILLVACVCVTSMRASHYPSAPQYTWAPRQALPPTHAPPQQYQKGQVTASGYNGSPGFWYGSSSKGDNWSYNRLPASGYAGSLYKNERVDKLSGPSANEGRVSGKAMAAGGYSKFTTNYQDPLHSRYGSFTIPPKKSQDFGRYGGYRNIGFYGAKGPAVPHYQQTGGAPLNIPPFRGSRIYEGAVGLRHNQTKKTGVYVIPTPSKLYYDGVKI